MVGSLVDGYRVDGFREVNVEVPLPIDVLPKLNLLLPVFRDDLDLLLEDPRHDDFELPLLPDRN